MKVKWTEGGSAATLEYAQSVYPDNYNPDDFDKHYEGEVIGTHKSFWGFTYLAVACTDGKIREVEIDSAKTIEE